MSSRVVNSGKDEIDDLFDQLDRSELEEQFDRAAAYLPKVLGKLDSTTLLYFYARYKQATQGPCATGKPGFFDFQGRQKWEAWNGLGSMSAEVAMEQYVARLCEIVPDWEQGNSEDGSVGGTTFGVTMSKPKPITDDRNAPVTSRNQSIFDSIQCGNLEQLRKEDALQLVRVVDVNGLTPLHWACDGRQLAIARFLVELGADVNAADAEGLRPLHYAANRDCEELVKLLLDNGASVDVRDADDLQPIDMCESEAVKLLLMTPSS